MGVVHNFNTALEKWLCRNGFTNIYVCEGGDYCYYYETHVIQWGMVTSEKTDRDFAEFFYEYGLTYDEFNTSVISFLHELGHVVTLPNFSEEEHNLDICAKEVITDNVTYWELPTEFAANVWAINWANSHVDEFNELHSLFGHFFNCIYSDSSVVAQIEDWMDDVAAGEDVDLCIEEEDEDDD